MKFEIYDIPHDAAKVYCQLREKEQVPSIEEGIAEIMSQPQLQQVFINTLMGKVTEKEIHDLFRGYHDEYDNDSDRERLRDLLLRKTI